MRKAIAFILYHFYYFKIRKLKNKDSILITIGVHNPKGKSIDKVIKWLLKNDYEFVTPNEVLQFQEGKLDKLKPVWLTVDDGWKNNYYELLPVLDKHATPATIFVSTKAIDDGFFWFNKARENRESELYTRIDDLWKMPNEKRVSIIEKLPKYKGSTTAMNRTELYNISKSKYVYIANHTHDHVICDMCNKKELEDEILLCEKRIKEITGKECLKVFAYPNGDFDEKSISVLKKLDYKIAATINIGFMDKSTDLYKSPRTGITDDPSLYEAILQIYGLWVPFFDKMRGFLKVRTYK